MVIHIRLELKNKSYGKIVEKALTELPLARPRDSSLQNMKFFYRSKIPISDRPQRLPKP